MILIEDSIADISIEPAAGTTDVRVPLGRTKSAVIVLWWMSTDSGTPPELVWKYGGSGGTTMTTVSKYLVVEAGAVCRVGISYIFNATPNASLRHIYKAAHAEGHYGAAHIRSISCCDLVATDQEQVVQSTYTHLVNSFARRGGMRLGVMAVYGTNATLSNAGGCATISKVNANSTFTMCVFGGGNIQDVSSQTYGKSWSGSNRYYSAVGIAIDNAKLSPMPMIM